MADLDIVIPVYNEGGGIAETLDALRCLVRLPFRVLICYDADDDSTLPVVRAYVDRTPLPLDLVKNTGVGAHGAVLSGFRASEAPAVLVFPADDSFNAGRIEPMMALFHEGADVVCASRFMPGGKMEGCPWLKATLVRVSAFTLFHVARLPTHDSTNGLRLFSRRLLQAVAIESRVGFAFSLELLVKCHRLGWRVAEVPALWFERTKGKSRFQVLRWLPEYLRWYRYAFATTFLRRGPRTVAALECLNRK